MAPSLPVARFFARSAPSLPAARFFARSAPSLPAARFFLPAALSYPRRAFSARSARARARKWPPTQSAPTPGPRHPSYRYRGWPGVGVLRGSVGRRDSCPYGRDGRRGSAPRRDGRPEGGRSAWGPPDGPRWCLNRLPPLDRRPPTAVAFAAG